MKKTGLVLAGLFYCAHINAVLLYVKNGTNKNITVKAGTQSKTILPAHDVPFEIGTRINTFVVTYPNNATESIRIDDGYYRGNYYWNVVASNGFSTQPSGID